MFIRTPGDERILVDGGASAEVIRHLTKILPFYSRHIDAVIATNTDGKNVSGLIDVLDRYDVGNAYIPAFTLQNIGLASSTDEIYTTFMATIEERGIGLRELEAGDELVFDHVDDFGRDIESDALTIALKVVFPSKPATFTYSKASAPELLFNLTYKKANILFMGDASPKVQKYIASTSVQSVAHSDVLVVSHSASAGNVSRELMSVVQPEYLIYSKSTTKSTGGISSAKKKLSPDPLAGLLDDQRWNLKEKGSARIVLGEDYVEVGPF